MGLIQRVLDEAGLSTLSLTQIPEIAAIIKPSRSLFVAHPFGLTFGAVGDSETQRDVVSAMLDAAESMTSPGMLVSRFSWNIDEQRHRQLRKQRPSG